MNEELAKIRELNGQPEVITGKPERIDDKRMTDLLYHLNENMNFLYSVNNSQEYNEQEFVEKIIDNMYTILSMLNEMNVYPGFFFRKVFEMNSKYIERKIEYENIDGYIRDKNKIRGNYTFFNDTHLSAWVSGEIRTGLNNGYYRVQAYPKTNISDAFLEILALFQKYDIPYKISTKEHCNKVFSDIYMNYSNNINALSNSSLIQEDIEYLCRILYDYISFFVSIGINPKKYLDKYIETKGSVKKK